MQTAIFLEKQPKYRYMKLPDGTADVFIYKFIETQEKVENDIKTTEYLYEFNQFRTSEITEDVIKENPYSFLDFQPLINVSEIDRIAVLEQAIIDIGEVLGNG